MLFGWCVGVRHVHVAFVALVVYVAHTASMMALTGAMLPSPSSTISKAAVYFSMCGVGSFFGVYR